MAFGIHPVRPWVGGVVLDEDHAPHPEPDKTGSKGCALSGVPRGRASWSGSGAKPRPCLVQAITPASPSHPVDALAREGYIARPTAAPAFVAGPEIAQVAELVDAQVSGTCGRKVVEVRVFSWAPKQ